MRVPSGAFATVPNKMAQELAESILSLSEGLKQPSPKSRFGTAAKPRMKAGKDRALNSQIDTVSVIL